MSRSGFTIWKDTDTGLYRWCSIYSNKYRDDDNPSEIISERSQVMFVEMVNKGIVDYPELWLWHVPVVWGKADFVDYIDGFAVAAGYVHPGCEPIAESLSKETNLATSHGMPENLLLRDEQDESVIIFHITKEISPLPYRNAANKRTGFVLLKGDEAMPFTDEKRAWLERAGRLPAKFVKQLEEQLDAMAAEAEGSGVQSKEIAEALSVVEAPVAEASAVESEAQPAEQGFSEDATTPLTVNANVEGLNAILKEANYATRDEVAQVLGEVLKPLLENQATLVAQFQSLSKELGEVRKVEADNQEKLKEVTPPLSLKELVARNLIGKSSAKVDESSALGTDKPHEKEASVGAGPTIVPFLNGILATAGGK